jgi:hypothetical protein
MNTKQIIAAFTKLNILGYVFTINESNNLVVESVHSLRKQVIAGEAQIHNAFKFYEKNAERLTAQTKSLLARRPELAHRCKPQTPAAPKKRIASKKKAEATGLPF